MRWLLRALRWVFLGGLLLALLAGGGGYLYLRQSLPQLDGSVQVGGIRGPVEIIRDVDAVPHIVAQNRDDALFGLGYVHAQDRLWQMELQRRAGQGRLAELFGEPVLDMDRFMRTLGIARVVRDDWAAYPADARAAISAYVAGINAFLDGHQGRRLPPEFTLLGLRPEAWTGEDVLICGKIIAWNQSGNVGVEMVREELAARIGAERAAQLFAPNVPASPEPAPAGAAPGNYSRLLDTLADIWALSGSRSLNREGIGSNSWVVDGSMSPTGKPILANDPHVGTALPALWYMAHLNAGEFDVIGATIPGLPSVVVGRNRSVAWGITNLGADVQDLFRERLEPSGLMAEFGGALEPMRVFTETIRLNNGTTVDQRVRITRHGPLISDAAEALRLPPPAGQAPPALEPLALRWTGLDPGDRTIATFLHMADARDAAQFTAALSGLIEPPLNILYADDAGTIGDYSPARIPIRMSGDGTLPVEGWSGQHEWWSFIPFDELPHRTNPAEHFIVAANQRITAPDYPYLISREWQPDYRARRITELLRAVPQPSLDDHRAIQQDIVSLYARDLLTNLLDLTVPQSDQERRAVELLAAWDAGMGADSPAASIFAAWNGQLLRHVAGDELGPELIDGYAGQFAFSSQFLAATLAQNDSPWCDRTTTPEVEPCAQIVQQALRDALGDLRGRLGDDMAGWRWDRLHHAVFIHNPLGYLPVLENWFSHRVPTAGDESSVNAGPYTIGDYSQYGGAMYRQIISLGLPQDDQFIVAIGQSGHVLSPFFDQYLGDWQAGRYRPLRQDHSQIAQSRVFTLQLTP